MPSSGFALRASALATRADASSRARTRARVVSEGAADPPMRTRAAVRLPSDAAVLPRDVSVAYSASASSTPSTSVAFSELPRAPPSPRGCSTEEEAAFCETLRETCHMVGFFYLDLADADADAGVTRATLESVLDAARKFFALPDELKTAMDNRASPAFRGYVRLGAENTAGRPDMREQVEFGVDAPVPDPTALADPSVPPHRRLVGPNQWPAESECPGFRTTVSSFLDEMASLSERLMELLALSLDSPRDRFREDEPNVQMKIARYPPAPDVEDAGSNPIDGVGTFGVGAHTDSGYLSLLLQDDVGGLQVKNGAGEWIDAPPKPDTVVVNLGEMVQLCTGGYYLATPHRVVSRATPTGEEPRDRISRPVFWNPSLDAVVRATELSETLTWQRPRPRVLDATDSHGEGKNALLATYGANALKSLARSHPEVMERHHRDLRVEPDGQVIRRR